MGIQVDALLSPAEYEHSAPGKLAGSVCVVFDVLRATSVIVTGLANGARSFIPVSEISEALQYRSAHPDVLLAGERNGLKISHAVSGGMAFDLGNSPREFLHSRIAQRDIVTTTTNGTRALRACVLAEAVLAAAFLNLKATAHWLVAHKPQKIIAVCAGTGADGALEDVLGAGALIELLTQSELALELSDAAKLALFSYQQAASELETVMAQTQNGARLLKNPELNADVEFCRRRDDVSVVELMGKDGKIRAVQ